MSQQGLRHAAAIAATVALGGDVAHPNVASYDYNGAFMALFDALSIADGEFNGRMLAFCNDQLSASHTDVNTAMNAFAVDQGALDWDGLGDFTAS